MSREALGPRNYWTLEEDEMLRREALIQWNTTGTIKNWNEIASRLPGRSNKDCRKRWSKVGLNVNRGHWSIEEDDRLRKAVEQHDYSWTLVAREVGTRHADQCAKRWCDFLDPALSHKDWEEEEYDRLLEAVQTYGRSWKLICEKVFPNRSATDIKNRYAVAQRRCENNLEFPQNYSSMSSKDMGISSQCKSIGNDSGLDVLSGVDLSNMDTELDYRPQYEEFLPNLYSATASAEALDYSLTSTLPDLLEFAIPLPTTERHPSDQSFGRNPYVSPADTAIPMAMDSFPADYNVIPEENMGYTTSSSSSATGSLFPRGSLPFSEGDLQAGLQTGDTTAKSDNFSNDRKSICSSSSPNSYTVLLEDVKPEMLCEIMNVVVQSTKIVKMKITSSEADQ